MSSPIWTPDALSCEARSYAGRCWRLVEAQHLTSTLKLVDDIAEQKVLEDLIEATKPPLPPDCRHLDYLLFTPFRYEPPYPRGSRFRRAGRTAGVYYAAERPETALAELAFYRQLFFADSPGTPWPRSAGQYTAFAAEVRTARHLDLTVAPLNRDEAAWADPLDYAPCQALADAARLAAVEIIRYRSVRDPGAGANLALLACTAFAAPAPVERRTWHMLLGPTGISAVCEAPRRTLSFGRDAFAADPRLAGMRWER